MRCPVETEILARTIPLLLQHLRRRSTNPEQQGTERVPLTTALHLSRPAEAIMRHLLNQVHILLDTRKVPQAAMAVVLHPDSMAVPLLVNMVAHLQVSTALLRQANMVVRRQVNTALLRLVSMVVHHLQVNTEVRRHRASMVDTRHKGLPPAAIPALAIGGKVE